MGWDGPLTHRQFLTWQAWLNLQLNVPSRSDHYAMQTAAYIVRANSKYPERATLDKFLISFDLGGSENYLSPEEKARREEIQMAWSKAKWCSALGIRSIPSPAEEDSLTSAPAADSPEE